MSIDGGSAGSLYLDVVADTSGFSRGLQRRLDRETATVTARIKAAIDARRLGVETRRAAKEAGDSAVIRVRVEVDARRLGVDLRRAAKAAAAESVMRVRAEVDDRGLQASLRRAVVKAERATGDAVVRATADTREAEAVLAATTRARQATVNAAERGAAEVNARIDAAARDRVSTVVVKERRVPARDGRGRFTGGGGGGGGGDAAAVAAASGGMAGLFAQTSKVGAAMLGITSKIALFPVLAAGILLAATAAGQLVAALGPSVGLIGVLPGLAGLAVQGLGGLLAGLSGVGEAAKAYGAAQAASGAAQEAAAARVAAAQKGLARARQAADRTAQDGAQAVADARQRSADVQVRAAQAVQSAEVRLSQQNAASQRAQQALTAARETARERLEDLALTVERAALSEEAAGLAVERARAALDKANRSATSTDLDRREADLAYRSALQSLKEIKESNADLAVEAAAAGKAGVEGSREVVDAQQEIVDAQAGVREAERALAAERVQAARDIADAQDGAARAAQRAAQANADAAVAIADAAAGVAEAQRGAAEAAGAVEAALDGLTPAGKRFVKFLSETVKPALKAVKEAAQEALLPPLQEAIRGSLTLLPLISDALVASNAQIGATALKFAGLFNQDEFRKNFVLIGESNARAIGSLGDAGVSGLSAMQRLMVAAAPIVERIAKGLADAAERFDTFLETKGTEKITGFFDRGIKVTKQFGAIIRDVAVGIANFFNAGGSANAGLLTSLEDAAARLREFTGDEANQQKFKDFLDKVAAGAKEAGDVLVTVFKAISDLADSPAMATAVGLLGDLLEVASALASNGTVQVLALALLGIGGTAVGVGKVGGALLGLKSNLTKARDGAIVAKDGIKALSSASVTGAKAVGGFGAQGIRQAWLGIKLGAGSAADAVKVVGSASADAAKAVGRFAAAMGRAAIAAARATVTFLVQKTVLLAQKVAMLASAAATGIATVATALLNSALLSNPIALVILALLGLVAIFVVAYKNSETFRRIVDAAFRAVKDAASFAYEWIKKNWPLLLAILTGPIGLAVYYVATHMDQVKALIGRAVDGIKSIWNGLVAVFRDPIQFVIDTVYNNGLRSVYNAIARLAGLPLLGTVTLPTGGPKKGSNGPTGRSTGITFATGGVVPGYAPGRDTVDARLSPGEGILTPQATRMVGGERGIRALNDQAGRTPSQMPSAAGTGRFAGGGVVKGFLSGAAGFAKEGVLGAGRVAGALGGLARDAATYGYRAAATTAMRPIRALVAKIGDTPFGGAAAGLTNAAIDGVLRFIGAKAKASGGDGGDGSSRGGGQFSKGGRWPQAILGLVSANTALASLFVKRQFGVNVGALGQRSNKSDHPYGKAIDAMVGKDRGKGNAIASALTQRANEFGLKYLIWYDQITTGSGWRPYSHPSGQSNPTLDHEDHVHASFLARGGVVRPRSGGTMAVLGEAGRSEAVVDEGLLNRRMSDLEALSALLAAAGTGGGGGVVLEAGAVQMQVHNPRAESTEETLNSRMRGLAEFGLFGGGR